MLAQSTVSAPRRRLGDGPGRVALGSIGNRSNIIDSSPAPKLGKTTARHAARQAAAAAATKGAPAPTPATLASPRAAATTLTPSTAPEAFDSQSSAATTVTPPTAEAERGTPGASSKGSDEAPAHAKIAAMATTTLVVEDDLLVELHAELFECEVDLLKERAAKEHAEAEARSLADPIPLSRPCSMPPLRPAPGRLPLLAWNEPGASPLSSRRLARSPSPWPPLPPRSRLFPRMRLSSRSARVSSRKRGRPRLPPSTRRIRSRSSS